MDPGTDGPSDHNQYHVWDTDDELEMEFFGASESDEVVSSSSSSNVKSSKVDHFVSMQFPRKLVIKAIEENGEDNDDAILNTILTYLELAKESGEDPCSSSMLLSHYKDDDALSDDERVEAEENRSRRLFVDKDRTTSFLLDMGYQLKDVVVAIEKCGSDAPIEELTDFICAMDAAKEGTIDVAESSSDTHIVKKRKTTHFRRQHVGSSIRLDQIKQIRIPQPMIGFGVPEMKVSHASGRHIPDDVRGRPYFYYENVALTPKGVWDQICRFLYDIEPEFVDSIYFSAAARKRGYIHNLPIENRKPPLPIPPKTIHEALPETKKWWPKWDKRTKLNCLLTCIGSAPLTQRIRQRVEKWENDSPLSDQRYVIHQCRKWNLVWVGKHRVAVLEPEDMEMLLGFPKNYTRGYGRTDRYKVLGNTFQVDTVAYHLSVLKPMFPSGMNVLSLFSGIGGAEIALDRLGIPLKNVVSVEISDVSRKIMEGWWEETKQKGNLIHVKDIQEVDTIMIDKWLKKFNGFDLVIGGSPCNNLAGGNRRTRHGLEGEHSSLFFHYYRILDYVRDAMKIM